jgi:hypothetical protein
MRSASRNRCSTCSTSALSTLGVSRPLFDFFWKQYVDRARNANRIDATERGAAMLDHDLCATSRSLRDIERITQIGLYSGGHGPKVPPGRSDPDHRLEVHILNHSFGIIVKSL